MFQAYCAMLIGSPENMEHSLSLESVAGDACLWNPMCTAMAQTTGNVDVQRWGCHAFATIPIPNIAPLGSSAFSSPASSPRAAKKKGGGGGLGSVLSGVVQGVSAVAAIRPGGRKGVTSSSALRLATFARRRKVEAILVAAQHHAGVSNVVIAASDAFDVSIEGLLQEFALRHAVATTQARASGGEAPKEESTAWATSWLQDREADQLRPLRASRPYCRAILSIAALIRADLYSEQLDARAAAAKAALSGLPPPKIAKDQLRRVDTVVIRQMNNSALALMHLCVACPAAQRESGARRGTKTNAVAREMLDVATAVEDGISAVVEFMQAYLQHNADLMVSSCRMLAAAVQCVGWRQQPRTLRMAGVVARKAFDAALVAANERPDDAELQLHASRVFARCVSACTAGERTHRVTNEAVAKSKAGFQTWAMKEAGRGWAASRRGLPRGGPFGVLVRAMVPSSKKRWVSRLFSTKSIHRDDAIELELGTRRGRGLGVEMCRAMFLLTDAHALNSMRARSVGAIDAVRAILHRHHTRDLAVGEWGCAAIDALVRDHDNAVLDQLALAMSSSQDAGGLGAIVPAAAAPQKPTGKGKAVKRPDHVDRARVMVADRSNASAAEAGESGCVELIVKVMKTHPDVPRLQLLGCGALDSLSHECRKNQARAGHAGALTVLVNVVERHQGDAQIVQQVFGALCRIASNDEVWPFIANSKKDVLSRPMATLSVGEKAQVMELARLTLGTKPVECVVDAMKRHARNDVVQYWGCSAIFSLVFPSPKAKERAGQAGITDALRDVIDHFMDNRVVLCQAFRAAHCITDGSTGAQEIAVFGYGKNMRRDGGLIPRCVRVMRHHPNDEQVRASTV